MKFRRGLTAAILMLALLAGSAFVACGDDDDDTNGDATPTGTSDTNGDAAPTGTTDTPEPGNGDSGAETGLKIIDPWARPSTNDVSAVYFILENSGEEDRLISATADVSPKVQIHEVVTDGASQRMQEVAGGIVVPAGGSVTLKPGGYHVMLMNLPNPLEAGDVVNVTLTFEKAGTLDLVAPVRAGMEAPNGGHMDQGDDMDHGDDMDDGDEEHS